MPSDDFLLPQRKRGRPTRGSVVETRNDDGTITFSIRAQVGGRRRSEVVARVHDHNRIKGLIYAEQQLVKRRYEWAAQKRAREPERITWAAAGEAWCEWASRHRTPGTVARYRAVFANLANSGAAPDRIVDTEARHLERYKDHLFGEGRAPSGINHEIQTLRTLWLWCRRKPQELIPPDSIDPFDGVEKLPASRPDKRILARDEIDAYRAAAPEYLRHVVDFALSTGLRMSELAYLEESDVDTAERYVSVVSKEGHTLKMEHVARSSRDRKVPLSHQAIAAYEAQLDWKRRSGIRTSIVFPSTTGDRFSGRYGSNLGGRVRRFMVKAGIEGGNLHACRHTFCTRALSHTRDLSKVMAWMGHSSIETTQQYLHYVPDAEVDAMADFEV